MNRIAKTLVGLAVLALFLASCVPGAVALTPQQAALSALTQQNRPNAIIDQSSIQIRQTVQLDKKSFVLISYSQVEGVQKSSCLTAFELEQTNLRIWRPNSAGGGCTITLPGSEPPPVPPMDVGGGSGGKSSPTDPGYSHVNGLVNQADIVKARVTWNDGQQQEVDVVNGSYMAVRPGQLRFQKVEGLNATGAVVYSNEPQIAPGKE